MMATKRAKASNKNTNLLDIFFELIGFDQMEIKVALKSFKWNEFLVHFTLVLCGSSSCKRLDVAQRRQDQLHHSSVIMIFAPISIKSINNSHLLIASIKSHNGYVILLKAVQKNQLIN